MLREPQKTVIAPPPTQHSRIMPPLLPANNLIPLAPSAPTASHVHSARISGLTWYFWGDIGWEAYDKESQARLTACWKFGSQLVPLEVFVPAWGIQACFVVDMAQGLQYHDCSGPYEAVKPNRKAPCRKVSFGPTLPVAFRLDQLLQTSAVPALSLDSSGRPKSWMSKSRHGGTIRLNEGSEEYSAVVSKFRATLPSRVVVTVFRIEHPERWAKYSQRQMSLSATTKEYHLFHGSNAHALQSIVAGDGISLKHKKHFGAYGKGVYFARDASLSEAYTLPDEMGERHMLLCRVLLGKVGKGDPATAAPPPECDATGNPNLSIVVKYTEDEKYEEYVISYRKE